MTNLMCGASKERVATDTGLCDGLGFGGATDVRRRGGERPRYLGANDDGEVMQRKVFR